MADEQQVTTKEPQQVTTKEPQQVTTKDPKKVEAGRRLAAHNGKKRELKAQSGAKSEVSQYYSIGAVLAVGVIGGLGYYIYQSKKGGPKSLRTRSAEGFTSGESIPSQPQSPQPPQQPHPKTNKFEMD